MCIGVSSALIYSNSDDLIIAALFRRLWHIKYRIQSDIKSVFFSVYLSLDSCHFRSMKWTLILNKTFTTCLPEALMINLFVSMAIKFNHQSDHFKESTETRQCKISDVGFIFMLAGKASGYKKSTHHLCVVLCDVKQCAKEIWPHFLYVTEVSLIFGMSRLWGGTATSRKTPRLWILLEYHGIFESKLWWVLGSFQGFFPFFPLTVVIADLLYRRIEIYNKS